MPLVQIKGISGCLSLQQKQDIISKVTDAILAVEGEGLRPVTWVLIEDVASGEWGVGGQPVTTDALREMSIQQRHTARQKAGWVGIGDPLQHFIHQCGCRSAERIEWTVFPRCS